MKVDYLAIARNHVTAKHQNLLRFLPPDEIASLEQDVPDGETPLWAYWEDYVIKTIALGKSPVTIQSVRDAAKFIVRHSGLVSIEQINTANALDRALLGLQVQRGQKPSTRNNYIKNINTYFIWLFKNHLIEKNNLTRIEKGRECPVEIPPLTYEEIERFVLHVSTRHHCTALERARNILMIDIFRFSGIRPSELLAMENDAIYLVDGKWQMIINGRKQKGRIRYYDVPSFVVHSYQHYMKTRADNQRWEQPLFISMSSCEGWTIGGLQKFFQKTSFEIGVHVTAYGFRRFVASQLSKAGVARDDLSRYLGHTRFSTTDRYIERDCYLTRSGTNLMKQIYQAA